MGFGWLGAILGALFNAIASAWRGRQQDRDSDLAHERVGAAEAANETQEAIADVADQRSQVPADPDDPVALAARLHRKAEARSGGSDQVGIS